MAAVTGHGAGHRAGVLEAERWQRRRLAGALAGREPGAQEPGPPWPRVLGSLVLALLLALLPGLLDRTGGTSGQVPVGDLQAPAFVLGPEGQPAVLLESDDGPVLHPVTDATSAQLLVGPAADPAPDTGAADGVAPVQLTSAQARDLPRGRALGVSGAPTLLPTAAGLDDSAWVACSGVDGIAWRTATEGRRGVIGPQVVRAREGGGLWLLVTDASGGARRLRLRLPHPVTDDLLSRLGLPAARWAPRVATGWLRLVPRGADVSAAALGEVTAGGRVGRQAPGRRAGVLVGDAVARPGGGAVVAADGRLRLLGPLAWRLWQAIGPTLGARDPGATDVGGSPAGRPLDPNGWPDSGAGARPTTARTCVAVDDGAPVRVSLPDVESAGATEVTGSSGPVADGAVALVRSDGRPRWWLVVGGTGAGEGAGEGARRYRLGGADAIAALGWQPSDAVARPASWLRGVVRGPDLTRAAALRGPDGW
ncbi:type VII secretion protein EccB [Nocardioides sp. GY 10127]|uniref:type VII secretion protein EccB n=1 Tax=Nocardioides sp. GY 10127 TaxID=2569762 RepID=UPI0010A81708|nr:type VII secretion protein EccB [Nocardioides sp. GY 10127]TIC82528.1 hypothetical protein E8D37_07315 [Nocardioides sp. GY 10127]